MSDYIKAVLSKYVFNEMKNNNFLIGAIFGWLLLSSLALSAQSYTLSTVPNPKDRGTGYISDPDAFLSDSIKTFLNQFIADIEDSTTVQIAVVLVESIGEQSPKDFAGELFNLWGIGQAGKDNGLLIFSAMDQRRTEFETGYGLEGVLPDAYCYRIGMQKLVPHFKNNDYGKGLVAALEEIRHVLENPEAVQEVYSQPSLNTSPASKKKSPWPTIIMVYLLLNLLYHLYVYTRKQHAMNSRQELYDKYKDIEGLVNLFFTIVFPIPNIWVRKQLLHLLQQLRDAPRHSRINGKPMRCLSDTEEKRLLDKGQIVEEEIGSVDYDVWVTDNEDDILILRYDAKGSFYSSCPSCGYKTYYLSHEETTLHPTYHSAGERIKEYSCKNCRYREEKIIVLPQKQQSSGGGGSFGSGSGSSGSSSWGGGSSGGGGAGVSW